MTPPTTSWRKHSCLPRPHSWGRMAKCAPAGAFTPISALPTAALPTLVPAASLAHSNNPLHLASLPSITAILREDHRPIEVLLDALEAALKRGEPVAGHLARLAEAVERHALREAPFWELLGRHAPAIAAKLADQHAQEKEALGYFADANSGDQLRLARRYHALVEHNLIEEERDVFPLADRCFTPQEQEELLAGLGS
jgi:hypothetical protein